MKRFFLFFCTLVFMAGSFLVAQDKDEEKDSKPLIAKPVKEKETEKKSEKPKDKDKEPKKKKEKPKKAEEKKPKKKEGFERLSELFQTAWEPKKTLSDEEKTEFLSLLPTMLPGKDFLGEELEWRLLFRDADEKGNDLVTVNLSKKGSGAYAREMWFQFNYKTNFNKANGNTDFEGYHTTVLPGVHRMVLIGHIEIRAVASADSYKRQSKIDEVLKAFPLKKIEKL